MTFLHSTVCRAKYLKKYEVKSLIELLNDFLAYYFFFNVQEPKILMFIKVFYSKKYEVVDLRKKK